MSTKKEFQHWQLEKDQDHILWLTLDRNDSHVNTLNREVLEEFNEVLDQVANDNTLQGLIITSGKSSGFIAGADIEQFTALKTEKQAFELVRQAQKVFDKLQRLRIPSVAMIDGFCLGGGFELALACRYRIAHDTRKTRIGLPEVKLGIHPGWGGTVRLVRLIGVFKAMSVMLTGRTLSAKAAAKLGAIDAAVPERMLKRAARYHVQHKPSQRKLSVLEHVINIKFLRPLIAEIFYNKLSKKINKSHYPAPFSVVSNWVKNGAHGERAYHDEAESISNLFLSETSRNLVRVFFLQTRLKALAKSGDDVKHVHVIGAGTMGGDIAAWCVYSGLSVTLEDRGSEYIAPAVKRAFTLFKSKYKRDKRALRDAMDRFIPDPNGLGVKHADVVIEAIFENLEAKHELFKRIEPQLKPDAVIATNTSTLPLNELNKVLKKPNRLVGIHFFNPVAKMQLVEVIFDDQTDKNVVTHATRFVKQINRLPLPVKSGPGFLVNRVLMPYLLESVTLMHEGFPAPIIDKIAVDFGMPMGPVELADTVGLDICVSAADILTKHLGGEVPQELRDMVERGALGRKSGRGFYRYNKKGKKIAQVASGEGIISTADVADRLILRMLNEAMACLREGIIEDKDLLDAGMIFGTGFAPFRGGPMFYAEHRGVRAIVERLEVFAKAHGKRYTPDPGWKDFA